MGEEGARGQGRQQSFPPFDLGPGLSERTPAALWLDALLRSRLEADQSYQFAMFRDWFTLLPPAACLSFPKFDICRTRVARHR